MLTRMMFTSKSRRSVFTAALFFFSLLVSNTRADALAKFEPAKGAYLGAFIETDGTVRGNIGLYETLTRKKHASYFTYCGYGTPFPGNFVAKVKRAGAVPHLAFEPNNGLEEVKDGPYLRAWARDAARTKVPIFLRWASEMNGPWTAYGKDPALYIEKFRLVTKIMREEAPNVAMLWTPFCEPTKFIDPYYPGDAHVDWVGVNIYSVYVNNGDPTRPAWDKDPIDFLRYVYQNYASRKPIHISEFAATLHCKGTSLNTTDFAIQKIQRFYDGVRQNFPRVKSINYFCLDTVKAGLANNNYSFLQDGRVLNVYNEVIANPHYLEKVAYNPASFPTTVKEGTTIGPRGIKIRPSSDELAMLASTGSVAANLLEPRLRGVQNGEIVKDDFVLSVQLPLNLQPRGLLWQINGRTFAITNSMPYRVNVSKDRWGPGHHTLRVIVMSNDDMSTQISSPPVEFEFAP